jgi:ubiquinone biosynthesis accessory factor UbiK
MINAAIITKIGQQLVGLLPDQAKATRQEVDRNVHAILQGAFARLDLVTRDEFDAQAAVLQRTREKVEQLESIVTQLEQQLKDTQN